MSEVPVAAPPPCPRCAAGAGEAFKFAPQDPGYRRVLLRCKNCGHRWSIIEAAPNEAG